MTESACWSLVLALGVLASCGPAESSAHGGLPSVAGVASSASPSASAPKAHSSAADGSAALPPLTPPDTAQRDRLKADVARVAVERPPGSKGWEAVRAIVTKALDPAAFSVETRPFEGNGKNVIGVRKGTERPNEIVILSAHYDHIPRCRGADDNASGVAVVMEAARQLGQQRFPRTLVLAFWDMEEDGLVGSRAYAAAARRENQEIALMISLDSVGYADNRPGSQSLPPAVASLLPEVQKELAANEHRGNFIVALGDSASSRALSGIARIGAAVGQPAFGIELSTMTRLVMTDAARSDHASFWLAGYPGILFTDTAPFRNPNYHCTGGPDDAATLDYEFLNRVASVVIRATTEGLVAR